MGRELPHPHVHRAGRDRSFVLADKRLFEMTYSLRGDVHGDCTWTVPLRLWGGKTGRRHLAMADPAGLWKWDLCCSSWRSLRTSHVHTSASSLKYGQTALLRLAFVSESQKISTVSELATLRSTLCWQRPFCAFAIRGDVKVRESLQRQKVPFYL